MRRLVVINHLSLDGVMQAPARQDEDTRGGFAHGGWAIPGNDPVMFQVIGEGMAGGGPLLFGRRTYEDFAAVWPKRTESPFSAALGNAQKYVVSRSLREPLPWKNSHLLQGDARDSVAALKMQPGPNLAVFGSGALIRSIASANLIDEYILLIHPVILGTGERLFADPGQFTTLRLTASVTTATGVVIATYQPATSG